MTGCTARSLEIGSHLERVTRYCALMAGSMGLDAESVRVASRLRDVGMAAVADAVEFKPGPLSRFERREMQKHPELGHAILAGTGAEVLDAAAEIALTHHERFDGSGYPRGLAAEEIPLPGRIMAVADTFDALTTNRVYRAAGTVEEAVVTLRAERGCQLDPHGVDALLSLLETALAIRERFAPPAGDETARGGDQALLTLSAATTLLNVSPSRLRRWSDEGRLPTVRTAGGHRRFPLEAVRALATERGVRPIVRAVEPPTIPLTLLAEQFRSHGEALAAGAAAAIYRDGPAGWFAGEAAAPELRVWLDQLIASCTTGRYAGALDASEALMRRAELHAASLLERHAFLERFGQVSVRALARARAESAELSGTRRLFASLQQSLLEADR